MSKIKNCNKADLSVLANAIYDAVGVRLYTAPFTPETVYKAIKERKMEGCK